MDAFLGLLKANLTEDEYNGYLKGSAALSILNINIKKNNGCAFFAKQYLDELMAAAPDLTDKCAAQADAAPAKKTDKANTGAKPLHSAKAGSAGGTKRAKTGEKIDAEEIRRLYIDQNIPALECSEILGVSYTTFKRILRENKIIKVPRKKASATSESNPDTSTLDEAAAKAARDILYG